MLNSKKKQIQKIVEKIWREYSLEPGFNIYDLLNKRGFVHRDDNLKEGMSGALLIDGDLKIIATKESDGPQRKRFTIAHEMGHEALHDGFSVSISSTNKLFYRDTKSSTGEHLNEVEANYFAACLLMPESKIILEIENTVDDAIDEDVISRLAKQFDVSIAAMAIRLSSLGFV